jgi:ABC-type nitrate/sulfonate/bicarbonate transport system substrate-binding protein
MTTVDLICFPGAPNLPIFAALEQGLFEKAGITLNLTTTPNSAYQAENLASGKFQIAGTAFDNVVAYVEGQGAVKFPAPPDFFAFMGATQIELAFIAQPAIKTYADVKGKVLAMDALYTGFAFALYDMLAKAGLSKADYTIEPVGATPVRWEAVKTGSHAGTLTIEPFTSIARGQGFSIVDTSTKHFPDYQGGAFAASRKWAAANPDAVKGFIKGYLGGLAWTLKPENKDEATALLLKKMPEINPKVAGAVMKSLLSPASGLTPYGAILPAGVAAVLDLRSRYGNAGSPGKTLDDQSRYVDLQYYKAVVGG